MILVIDNYDSFTFNLVQYLRELGEDVRVERNDGVTLDAIEAAAPSAVVISPGPGAPEEAGISVPLVRRFAGRFPILGVCLGHQAIGAAYGGRVERASSVMHGKTSLIEHDGAGIFDGLPNPLRVMRYHSLMVAVDGLPAELEMTAIDPSTGEIHALRHRELPLFGVQFHPESILSEGGHRLLANFLRMR